MKTAFFNKVRNLVAPKEPVSRSDALDAVRTHAGATLMALRGAVSGNYRLLEAYEPHNLYHVHEGAFDHLLPYRGRKLAIFKESALAIALEINRLRHPLLEEAKKGFKLPANVNEVKRRRIAMLLKQQAVIENRLMRWFKRPAITGLRRALNA
jgi:hypothetical protein